MVEGHQEHAPRTPHVPDNLIPPTWPPHISKDNIVRLITCKEQFCRAILCIAQSGSVAVNHARPWILRQQFESAPDYIFRFFFPFIRFCFYADGDAKSQIRATPDSGILIGYPPQCSCKISAEQNPTTHHYAKDFVRICLRDHKTPYQTHPDHVRRLHPHAQTIVPGRGRRREYT